MKRIQSVAASALLLTFAHFSAACSGSPKVGSTRAVEGGMLPAEPAVLETVSIVGTNDLHGHIEMLPLFSGYVHLLRQKTAVVLVDGGDMFQGTLASNLAEGAPIVAAYNLLKYDAVTIGNHEFDFGPVGPDSMAQTSDQDPRGALKALAASAEYPFLAANIIDEALAAPVDWPNVRPTALVTVQGPDTAASVQVGIIGLSTFETPQVTLPANFVGLKMAPLAEVIAKEAATLRARGAKIIVVAAHAGGICEKFDNPKDLSSCEPQQEIFEVARALPTASVDVIVAGHTHRAVAHQVNGIAIIESFARGGAFGRVDLALRDGKWSVAQIHPPRSLCRDKSRSTECDPGEYEGSPVEADLAMTALAEKAEQTAETVRKEFLGVTLPTAISRSRSKPSALGNLFVDLMLAAQPKAQVAFNNGGSLRANLPAGPLTYGSLFEAQPFDNRFARLTMSGANLREIIATNLQKDNGILSIAGMRVKARCKQKQLAVELRRNNGTLIRDKDILVVVTSDFLASGGDGLIDSAKFPAMKNELDKGELIRDVLAQSLRTQGGTLLASPYFDPKRPRIQYPGSRPMQCN